MTDVCDYLLANYYSKHPEFTPSRADLMFALTRYAENVIVVRHNGDIKTVAIYLTLTDGTHDKLTKEAISDIQGLSALMKERGDNYHFILVCADRLKYIIQGMNQVKKRKPKMVSWYNPAMTRLHRYEIH